MVSSSYTPLAQSGSDSTTLVNSDEQDDFSTMTSEMKQNLYNPKRSTLYIIILTLILGAVQLAWSLEFSEATPFLLSLGISKQVLALIWLAGPLSGSIGQPIVGLLSDQCNLSLGRRRPFVLTGCIATTLSVIYLAHSTQIVGFFTGIEPGNVLNSHTVFFAAVGIYVLDFSIAVMQATSRALIVDVVPGTQQQLANAWAARMIGIFNITGFFIGTFDLVDITHMGDTQFKCLSIIISVLMICLTLFCCYNVQERNPKTDVAIKIERKKQIDNLRDLGLDPSKTSWFKKLEIFFMQIFNSMHRLPRQVWIVNLTEFCAWIGYFPMLFYTSSYVGEMYLHELGYNSTNDIPENYKQTVSDEMTRKGTQALLAHSVVTLLIDLLLPYLIEVKKGDIRKYWTISHLTFTICTVSTFFISHSAAAIVLMAVLGIPWGCAVWIPFVLIGEEISRIKDIKALQITNGDLDRNDSNHEDTSTIYTHENLIRKYDQIEYDSGILLAIHNVFVSAPQMISSLCSSILFKLLSKVYNDGKDDSIAWCFRLGGLACIGAYLLSLRVKSSKELYDEDERELENVS